MKDIDGFGILTEDELNIIKKNFNSIKNYVCESSQYAINESVFTCKEVINIRKHYPNWTLVKMYRNSNEYPYYYVYDFQDKSLNVTIDIKGFKISKKNNIFTFGTHKKIEILFSLSLLQYIEEMKQSQRKRHQRVKIDFKKTAILRDIVAKFKQQISDIDDFQSYMNELDDLRRIDKERQEVIAKRWVELGSIKLFKQALHLC